MGEIVNRVANSALITFNLEDYYPAGVRVVLDISQWLDGGIILRESSFRESVNTHDWQQYQDAYVAINCSTEAIIPAWAHMLVATKLQGVAKKAVAGTLETLETILYTEVLTKLDTAPFENKPIIVKGCAHLPVPENAYLLLIEKLQPIARSLLFGEACSSVPLYKRPKK
ncbi:MAG: DUF2480 family protein [Dokdonia sp.]|jgi:hypothetical protein|nr:hypothetical protein [Cytophagaceae bacterium]|tara:strand:+ start:223 stop:732 length:510 start_codon:yes stop_codon:yes gene_type:complete